MSDTLRLDQWLWTARFFKTRALATAAVKNGRIRVNGQPAKPARKIVLGDELYIQKQAELVFTITIAGISDKRVSASIAQTLYHESEASRQQRLHRLAQQKIARNMVAFPTQRPDKRARRDIRALKHHQE